MQFNNEFSDVLLSWFDQHGRKDLPWQQDKTPYRVWVSEIMLQQTQVSSVIEYFQRFMARFPTLKSLAQADIDEVLTYWAGLGYYARGRNLHKTARMIASEYGGTFPNQLEQIMALPGIGRSTAGAILSIALNTPTSILDGNVKRVFARLEDIEGWPGSREIEKRMWAMADQRTPTERCDDYTQAIMDMGATLCTRSKPRCDECPFAGQCKSLQNGTVSERPTSKPRTRKPTRELWLLDVRAGDKRLLEKRPNQGIWGGLYSLPEIEPEFGFDELEALIEQRFGLSVLQIQSAETFEHIFSHYKLIARPVVVNASKQKTNSHVAEMQRYHWLDTDRQEAVALPAPIQKYFKTSGK